MVANLKYLAFMILFTFVGSGIDSAFTSTKALMIWAVAVIALALLTVKIISEE